MYLYQVILLVTWVDVGIYTHEGTKLISDYEHSIGLYLEKDIAPFLAGLKFSLVDVTP